MANRAKGGRETLDRLFVVKSSALLAMTCWISGWEGCFQDGLRGDIVSVRVYVYYDEREYLMMS